jgi:glutaminyl-peptide cyclotransferase
MLARQMLLAVAGAGLAAAADFSGASALEFARRAVEFGPRPAGSPANRQLQLYILEQLKSCGCEVTEDAFTARVPMRNIVARFPGSSGRAIAVTGHFDTKNLAGGRFVGANDGGSSTGLLLALARVLAGQPRVDDVYLVWFDGEEAFGEWSASDSVWGSRHLAERWRADGTLARLKALINVDMIGDRDLNILDDLNSTPALRRLAAAVAADLGYAAHFSAGEQAMEDDHLPFLALGAPAIDLIDFDYEHWHQDSDTLDKLSAGSLEIVGKVVLEMVRRLETAR